MSGTETDDERTRRVVGETGERLREDCIRLAKRHNDWLLRSIRSVGRTVEQLYWRQPKTWTRDIEEELEWMALLGMVYEDEVDGKEVWRAAY